MTENIKESLEKAIKKFRNGAVIMMELPTESYFDASSSSIKALMNEGFEGVYISFQRPFKNIFSLFADRGIDVERLLFIDAATSLNQEVQEENPKCIHISEDIDIDELVRAIYTSLPRLRGKKKFIFIDSLTTIALYKPLSETMRFSEFLIRTVRKAETESITLIFNVAKDLAQEKFIKDIALHVDEIISLG
jgi:KaiC/GvpD/RAD55 family RecA-like ATPase